MGPIRKTEPVSIVWREPPRGVSFLRILPEGIFKKVFFSVSFPRFGRGNAFRPVESPAENQPDHRSAHRASGSSSSVGSGIYFTSLICVAQCSALFLVWAGVLAGQPFSGAPVKLVRHCTDGRGRRVLLAPVPRFRYASIMPRMFPTAAWSRQITGRVRRQVPVGSHDGSPCATLCRGDTLHFAN